MLEIQTFDPINLNRGNKREPNILIRGSNRIDFVFYSKEMFQFITACSIPSFGYISSSSHCSICLDINFVQYLRNPFIDTKTNNSQLLQSKDPTKKTVQRRTNYFYQNKIKITSKMNDMQQKLHKKMLVHKNIV